MLVWMALLLGQGIDPETLALLIGSAIDSSILPLFAAFFLGYAVFQRKDRTSVPKGYHDLSSAPVKATMLSACLLLLYRLFGKIMYALDFLNYFLLPSTKETVTIILDFVLILITSACGYYITLLARRLYRRAELRAAKE